MEFPIKIEQVAEQQLVLIERRITLHDYRQWMPTALRRLHNTIIEQGGRLAGDPLALYYGPVNETEDGPVAIAWPFAGNVSAQDEIEVRTLPPHKAASTRIESEDGEYSRLFEAWDAVANWLHANGKQLVRCAHLTCYEVWPQDRSLIITYPFN